MAGKCINQYFYHGSQFGWFAHPIFTTEGGFPAVMVENVKRQSEAEGLTKPRLEQFDDYWTQRIKGTSDFLGINHYTTHLITGPGLDPLAKSPSWLKDIGAVTTMDVGGDSASEWLRVRFLILCQIRDASHFFLAQS